MEDVQGILDQMHEQYKKLDNDALESGSEEQNIDDYLL